MCKLLLMTGLKNPELTSRFMFAAKSPMSLGNNMGIGYTAVKSDGEFFTERWHKNDQFFDRDSVLTPEIIKELEPYRKRLPDLSVNYSLQGEIDFSKVSSVTMHTRYATCGREFQNTHPFVDSDTSLVHNGVISNSHQLGLNKISTCDSEAALQSYLNIGVNRDIKKSQDWIDTLAGYWAFGIFSRDASGRRILDIIRNDANLYSTNIEGFGVVTATVPDIIIHSASILGLKLSGEPQLIRSNMLWRIDAVTGDVIEKLELKDSKLNTRVQYYGMTHGVSSEEYEKIFGTKKVSEPIVKMPKVGKTKPSTTYSALDRLFDDLDNNEIPLLSRLEMYDDAFEYTFTEMYWQLPYTMISEDWESMDFFDVLDEIEDAFNAYCGEKAMQS